MTFLKIYLILNTASLMPGMDMKKFLALAIISISILGNAQVRFDYLTADDGLSDNQIYSVYRDSKDYLWIGTSNNGVNKYDGNNMTIYENVDNEPGAISNNGVQYIFEDSKNNLWIGTQDGLNRYNPQSESFTVFRHAPGDIFIKNSNYVTCIAEDKKGNLWATYNYGCGLIKWDYENNSYTSYRIKKTNDDYFANSMTSIGEDAEGRLWVASQSTGIYRFDPETGSFIAYDDPSIDFGKNLVKRLYVDKDNKIWIASFGSGLYSFDPSTGKFRHYGINNGNQGLNSLLVKDIIRQDDNHLLIATDQWGINRYNMASNTFEYIIQDEKFMHGLNCNGVLCLHQDKEGILWAGTSRGGVDYYNPKQYKFESFGHNRNDPNSLSYNIVGCFDEDSKGAIWIGTDGGGLNVYNPKTGDFTVFRHDPADPASISGDVIRCISEDKDNDIWIGTWGAGLNRYDKKTGKFHHYFPDPKDTSSISSKTTWHLLVDHNNNIWLSSFMSGIEILDKKKGVLKRFLSDPKNPRSLSHNDVWMIYEDLQHNIWFCSRDGVNLYDSITASFSVYNNFPDNNIEAFCRDKEGKLWAGSNSKGLFLFKRDGTIVKVYNKKNGLPDNTIRAIVEDNSGNLWISTTNGLCHFNQKTGKFRNYYKSDGLQGNGFFEQSYLKAKDGKIYFGGENGFDSFYPDSLKDNSYVPKVYITGFKLFNKSVPFGAPGSPLQNHISGTKEITLSWHESVFSFEFVAINYTHPEKNEYAYKMEGFERDWNYVGDKKDATYTNMDAGEYTFRVKASNNDGVWNEEGASIKIIILPPWWNTWWFRVLVVCTVLYSTYSFFRYRTTQLRNQKIVLAKKVKERTLQLEETNTLLEETNTLLEEKQEEISLQNEELQCQKENLQEINTILKVQAEEIESQKNELDQHRNHLEQLVEERTEDLVAALKKVEESNRLKTAFLSNMSHEIRTPMNAIVGFASLLNDPELSDTEKNMFTTYISTNSEALLVLIDDILEMSQIQANQLDINCQPVDVIGIVMELQASFHLQAQPKGIKLMVDTGTFGDTLICSVDPVRLKQLLSNLISNAIKFTEEGFVWFGIAEHTPDFITFYVKDSGIGISKEIGDSIFEHFLKVESVKTKLYEGVGLGLSICRSLVKAMGGNIWYESEVGKGTTFYFTLPYNSHENVLNAETKHGSADKVPDLENKQILIVEDDENNYQLLVFYLTKTKAGLTWAKNGQDAVEYVKSNNNFDLILMDLRLPVMNGAEATRLIRQINPGQLIVAQTAFAHKEEKKEFLKYKFNDYLEKPISMEKLMEVLNKVLKDENKV